MSNVDLSALLAQKADTIEKPKPLPTGHYGWMVGSFEPVTSSKKGTPGIEFQVTPYEAKDDVDQDELAKVKDPFKKARRLTFWLTEDSLFMLTSFFEKLGLDMTDKSISELLPETQTCQFTAPIVHQMRDNGDMMAVLNENAITAAE